MGPFANGSLATCGGICSIMFVELWAIAISHRRGEGAGMQGLRERRAREASGACIIVTLNAHCDNREHWNNFHLLACIVFFLCFYLFIYSDW